MKRFLLFAGPRYYPGGGVRDLIASFDTIDEATAALANTTLGDYVDAGDVPLADISDEPIWWHIYDHEAQRVVAAGGEHAPLDEDDYPGLKRG